MEQRHLSSASFPFGGRGGLGRVFPETIRALSPLIVAADVRRLRLLSAQINEPRYVGCYEVHGQEGRLYLASKKGASASEAGFLESEKGVVRPKTRFFNSENGASAWEAQFVNSKNRASTSEVGFLDSKNRASRLEVRFLDSKNGASRPETRFFNSEKSASVSEAGFLDSKNGPFHAQRSLFQHVALKGSVPRCFQWNRSTADENHFSIPPG